MPAWLHPYRAARVVADGITVGWFGQLHPVEAAARKSKSRSSSASSISTGFTSCRCASPPPATSRASSPCAAIFRWFSTRVLRGRRSTRRSPRSQIPEMVEWRAREVFRDARLGVHEYSLLLGVTFQAPDRTLREEELQAFQAQVVDAVAKAGARLRTLEPAQRGAHSAILATKRENAEVNIHVANIL